MNKDRFHFFVVTGKVWPLALFVVAAFFIVRPLFGDTPPKGKERLRELAVFPVFNLNFTLNFNPSPSQWRISDGSSLSEEISGLRGELKQQPNDIDRLLHLAFLLSLNTQTNEERVVYQQVEALCRKAVAAKPQDGLLLVKLGEALWGLEKVEETESVLRKSVLISSNDWQSWTILGVFLEGESCKLLVPTNSPVLHASTSLEQMKELLEYRPAAEALKKSEVLNREAARCIERATALGSQKLEFWLQRSQYATAFNLWDRIYRHAHNQEPMEATLDPIALFFKPILSDLRKAAALSSSDCRLICFAAYAELACAISDAKAIGKINSPPAEYLPDATRRSIHDAMTRLENISQSSDKKLAARALECRGILTIAMGDPKAGLPDFRRAVALDPTREESWDVFLGSSDESDRQDICESRLKARNSARNHVLLAKILEKNGKWERSKQEAEAALKLEPDNIAAHLMLVALFIRQSTDEASLDPVKEHVEASQKLWTQMPDGQEKKDRFREVMLNGLLAGMLWHYPEYVDGGKKGLQEFLRDHPDDEDAKNILAAIE